jgi:hypothetical protein
MTQLSLMDVPALATVATGAIEICGDDAGQMTTQGPSADKS